MRLPLTAMLGFLMVACAAGCHRAKPPATPSDVAAAQAEAQKEVAQARVEATKDVKSAAKLAGSQSRDVAVARVTGAYDIAMAKADGEHNVALEQCLLLQVSAQQACKNQADAAYQTAAAAAKANRASRQQ